MRGGALFIQFMAEDASTEKLIDAVMAKFILEYPRIHIAYNIKPYRGIGHFVKGPNAKENKSQQLLSELPKRLRAFNTELMHTKDASLFIVLDNDTRDAAAFHAQLVGISQRAHLSIDHVYCIAVEEMEAWLLGDCAAIQAAYCELADRIETKIKTYGQDSICGTWEFLADMLTPGRSSKFYKANPTIVERGKRKSEWAVRIGAHMNLRKNASPSFSRFLGELDKRAILIDNRIG
jgi:hypothetical protein